MPGPVGLSTCRPWRRWASRLDHIVTDDGATIDFHVEGYYAPTLLTYQELEEVTDDDVIHLLTNAVERINVTYCSTLTDASITAVARNCHGLTVLNVAYCENLTDASIGAVATNCPGLTELGVASCRNLTDTAVVAVADNCLKLMILHVSRCRNLTDASIAAVVDKCADLKELYAEDCGLTALPENIGKLSKLRRLWTARNQLNELPRSIAELDASCYLRVNGNPLSIPPLEIALRGIPAIKRYFIEVLEDVDTA